MHQVAISTPTCFNGADLGIRRMGAVFTDTESTRVCGTSTTTSARTRSAAGQNATLTPVVAATATDVIDTSKGTVHMVIGAVEHPLRRTSYSSTRAMSVITSVGEADPDRQASACLCDRASALVAVRNAAHSYASRLAVEPGAQPAYYNHDVPISLIYNHTQPPVVVK